MKKIYIWMLGLSSLFAMNSCGEDFLDVDHYDILQPEIMFTSEDFVNQGLNGLYDTFLPLSTGSEDIEKNWNIKPHLAFSNYPALDCQADGWDNEFTRHAWLADKDMFKVAWQYAYRAISRANTFLEQLKEAEVAIFAEGQTGKDKIEAQARAIRGYWYYYLAQNFGRVPMLKEGETYVNTPSKPRAESLDETYDFIISDLSYAAEHLDWIPENGDYGRITKGMAMSYEALTYMYKKDFTSAKALLKDIIDHGPYELTPCYGEIHQFDNYWSKESVWEVSFLHWGNLDWSANSTTDDIWWGTYLTAASEYGGWGALYISHEFARSFEPGDKRRQYSIVCKGETQPYTGEVIGATEGREGDFVGSENMPNNYSIKLWKGKAGNPVYTPISAFHLRYAAVLLNYAECCFQTEGADSSEGWNQIKMIRDRAWGNMEVGRSPIDNFPFEFNHSTIEVPDAKAYYTQYRVDKGYTSDVWKVALTIERRHEVLAEYSFWYDLCRSEMAKEFLECEYPQNNGQRYNTDGEPCTPRTFSFDSNRMLYPIPTQEILTNAAISQADQNPGY